MNRDEAFKFIEGIKAPVIFLTGKTSTGKTTFSKELVGRLGYTTIELDNIVNEFIVKDNPTEKTSDIFIDVYRNASNQIWKDQFINATKNAITNASKPVIVDGALANTDVMKAIFLEDVMIVFMHPDSLERYIERLVARFKGGMSTQNSRENTGLPKAFWSMVNQGDIDNFLETEEINSSLAKSFRVYAESSQKESFKRLNVFQSSFKNILIVNM